MPENIENRGTESKKQIADGFIEGNMIVAVYGWPGEPTREVVVARRWQPTFQEVWNNIRGRGFGSSGEYDGPSSLIATAHDQITTQHSIVFPSKRSVLE